MERGYKWQIGQRVKQKDPDDGQMDYGTVTDEVVGKVFIKWDSISDVCEHEEWEWDTIKLANSPKH